MLSPDVEKKLMKLFDAIWDSVNMTNEEFQSAFGVPYVNADDTYEVLSFFKERYRKTDNLEELINDLDYFYYNISPKRGDVIRDEIDGEIYGVVWSRPDRMGVVFLQGRNKDTYIEFPLHNGRANNKMKLVDGQKLQFSVESNWVSRF